MSYYFFLALILLLYMSFWFLVSLIKKRNDVADIAWGLGFILLAWVSFFLLEKSGTRGVLVSILVTIWGLRLSFYIYRRNYKRGEDYRYLAWRKEWGKWFYLRSYFQIYFLQGFLLFIIILPVLFINKGYAGGLNLINLIGLFIWLLGFYFEATSDMQLSKFIKNPLNKGKIMQSGLWAYTRHPNYFGEVTLWWGIWIMALSVSGGFFTIIGPLAITFLILKVSGIPMLEKKMEENPEFEDYKKRVSIFFPLPPKLSK